jgi:hypothetical protein
MIISTQPTTEDTETPTQIVAVTSGFNLFLPYDLLGVMPQL